MGRDHVTPPPVHWQTELDPWPGVGQQRIGSNPQGKRAGLVMPPQSLQPSKVVNTFVDMARFATLNGTKYATLSTASQMVLAAPVAGAARNLLMLRNPNTVAAVYVDFGQDSTTNSVVALNPGEILLFDAVVPQDEIYASASVPNSFFSIAWASFTLPVI